MILTICLAMHSSYAGGWTQPKGAHYAKVGVRVLPGSDFFPDSADPESPASTPYLDAAVEGYLEWGVSDDWTVIAQGTPVGFASLDGEGTPYAGVIQGGVRRALVRGRHNLSIQLDAGFTAPLGERDLFETGPTGADGVRYTYIPAQSGVQADALIGYGVGFGRCWLGLEAGGLVFSRSDFAPAVVGHGQFGVKLPKNNSFAVTVPFREHLGADPDTNLAGSGQTDFVGLGLQFSVTLGKAGWGLATGTSGVFRASGNEAAPTLPLYVTHQTL